jgi:hypothetical protein
MSLPELTQLFMPNLKQQVQLPLTQSISDVKIKPTEVCVCVCVCVCTAQETNVTVSRHKQAKLIHTNVST